MDPLIGRLWEKKGLIGSIKFPVASEKVKHCLGLAFQNKITINFHGDVNVLFLQKIQHVSEATVNNKSRKCTDEHD